MLVMRLMWEVRSADVQQVLRRSHPARLQVLRRQVTRSRRLHLSVGVRHWVAMEEVLSRQQPEVLVVVVVSEVFRSHLLIRMHQHPPQPQTLPPMYRIAEREVDWHQQVFTAGPASGPAAEVSRIM